MTTTEDPSPPKHVRARRRPTYSSTQVLEALNGRLTYRMLDYWCRTGAITPTQPANGSGDRRGFTDIELEAIKDLVDVSEQIRSMLHDLRTGQLFAERYAWHYHNPR